VIVFAEKYSPPLLIPEPLNVNPPAAPTAESDIAPEPAPVIVMAPSALKEVATAISELPVPFVIVSPAEATVIAVDVRSVFAPSVIVVTPDAEKMPRL